MATGSKIELFRISLYVFFPVAVFYYFNLPQYYDNFITEKRKQMYPPDEETYKPPTTIEDIKAARKKLLEVKKQERSAQQTAKERN